MGWMNGQEMKIKAEQSETSESITPGQGDEMVEEVNSLLAPRVGRTAIDFGRVTEKRIRMENVVCNNKS